MRYIAALIKSFRFRETEKIWNWIRSKRLPHSIRINDQWRNCFVWEDGDAVNVEIVDCH